MDEAKYPNTMKSYISRKLPLATRTTSGILDVPAALRLAAEQRLIGAEIELEDASYFLSQISIVPTGEPSMRSWRKKLFVTMSRNAANPAGYYNLPDDRTVLVGSRVEL